jgi:hypothetical protein
MKNRLKNERGEKKNAKNTSRTHELIQTLNTGGHEVARATIPSKIHGSYTNRWISGHLTQAPRGEKTLKEKIKIEEVREMGAPSSYLTGLLHNPSFAPVYK